MTKTEIQKEGSNTRRVAIVTGGSRGIGRRIAERLAHAQYAVLINYQQATTQADEVISGIARAGGIARGYCGDIADENAIAELFDIAEQEFGGIDVVVHAAAILPMKPLIEFDIDEVGLVLKTNLLGTFIINQQAALKVRRGGAIINISSAITRTLSPGYSAYAASKAGMEALTMILARELKGQDITVNAVAPGPTETDMLFADLANNQNGEQMRQSLIDAVPLQRIGTPEDIAEIVLALAGPVRWVNGQIIHTNGGFI